MSIIIGNRTALHACRMRRLSAAGCGLGMGGLDVAGNEPAGAEIGPFDTGTGAIGDGRTGPLEMGAAATPGLPIGPFRRRIQKSSNHSRIWIFRRLSRRRKNKSPTKAAAKFAAQTPAQGEIRPCRAM